VQLLLRSIRRRSLVIPLLALCLLNGSAPNAGAARPSVGSMLAICSTPVPAGAARQPVEIQATSTVSPTILTTIAMGAAPHGVAVSPDGSRVYVTDFTDRSVSVIDAASLQIVKSIPVGRGAVNVLLTADGSRAYVTNEFEDSLSVIDTQTKTVIKTIALPDRPHGMDLAPHPSSGEAERRLYVANLGSNSVSVIDTQSLVVITHIPVGDTPDSPLASPDGKTIWVTKYNGQSLSVVDTVALTETTKWQVGVQPHGFKRSADGSRLYLTLQGEDKFLVLDAATGQALDSPDGRFAWTGDLGRRSSTIVETATGNAVAQISYGGVANPHAIAFSPDGKRAYVSDFLGRRLVVVDTGVREQIFLPVVTGDGIAVGE
jgi:YVTN family beta-propeller protein